MKSKKMKQPKLKNKGYALMYDRASIPPYATWSDIVKCIKEDNVIFYDGKLGSKPQVINLGGDKNKVIIRAEYIDVSI